MPDSAGPIIAATITAYEALLLIRALVIWFGPSYASNPLIELLERVTEPVLEPVRRVLPVSEGIDLSPLLVLIALEAIKRLIL